MPFGLSVVGVGVAIGLFAGRLLDLGWCLTALNRPGFGGAVWIVALLIALIDLSFFSRRLCRAFG
jgi:hypothetical protein